MTRYDYGTVTFAGKTYTLTDQADFTSRLLPLNNYHEVSVGETYNFEMFAPAIGEDGEEYYVYWIFEEIKGEECDLDYYDYDTPDRVEYRY